MKKRLYAFFLTAVMAVSVCGCGEKKEENEDSVKENDKAQTVEEMRDQKEESDKAEKAKYNLSQQTNDEIRMYFGPRPANLDPSLYSTNSDKYRIISLLFEGLTGVDANGKVYPVGAQEWETTVDSKTGEAVLRVMLRETRWSDGIPVRADDYVYAFRRILMPSAKNTAYSLLAPIKNAAKVKTGEMSGSSLGVYAVSDDVLEFTFEEGFEDIDLFLKNLASPVLVPLREDKVDDGDWTNQTGSFVGNGPFAIKSLSASRLILGRNNHYQNGTYVRPARIHIYFEDEETAVSNFGKGGEEGYYYLENVSAKTYESFGDNASSAYEPSVYTYFFNTENEILADNNTRMALTAALDREKIAAIRGCGTEKAIGIVPHGARADDGKKDVLSSSFDKNVSFKKGTLYLSYNSSRPFEREIAEYAKGVWEDMGFTIVLEPLDERKLTEKVERCEFDIVAADLYCPAYDGFGMLAPFALEYSGSFVDVTDPDIFNNPHFTGYNNKEYNELIGEYYTSDASERKKILLSAEEMLLSDAVVAPLFFDKNGYISTDLDNVSADNRGMVKMNDISIKE